MKTANASPSAHRCFDSGRSVVCAWRSSGDESALVRVEIGDAVLEERHSYEFRDAVVKTYPGGWHSLSLTESSTVSALEEAVPVSQSDEYIERTYKILAGIQRKKGRTAGRLPPWRHPARRPRVG